MDGSTFLNKEIRKLDRQIKNLERIIEQLGKELKKKDELIAVMNEHGAFFEKENKELKEKHRALSIQFFEYKFVNGPRIAELENTEGK